MTTLFLAITWSLGTAQAACDREGLPPLLEDLRQAEQAHRDLDIPRLQAETDQALAAVRCIDRVVPVLAAARLHRVVGLDAFTLQERDRATRAFAAARSVDPVFDYPLSHIPAGHPLRTYYTALPLDAGTSAEVTVPGDLRLYFDGKPSTQRPLSCPSVAQVVGQDGAVISTTYLWPDDPLPVALAPAAQPLPATTPQPAPVADVPVEDASGRKVLRRVALLTAVVAGAAYGGSRLAARSYWEGDKTDEQLDRLYLATNGLLIGSAAFGIVALGTGVGAVVQGRF